MAHAVCRRRVPWRVTAVTPVWSQDEVCEDFGGQSGTGTSVCPSILSLIKELGAPKKMNESKSILRSDKLRYVVHFNNIKMK
jgi:hypothetical protein